jgi:hypothetical protein
LIITILTPLLSMGWPITRELKETRPALGDGLNHVWLFISDWFLAAGKTHIGQCGRFLGSI